MPWLTEEGLPQKGLFNVYYFGIDHGKKNKNFQANIKLRKSMLYLVRRSLHSYIYFSRYKSTFKLLRLTFVRVCMVGTIKRRGNFDRCRHTERRPGDETGRRRVHES